MPCMFSLSDTRKKQATNNQLSISDAALNVRNCFFVLRWVNFSSRAVWNDETDNFVSVDYKNTNCFAIATVHAAYTD